MWELVATEYGRDSYERVLSRLSKIYSKSIVLKIY